MAPSEFWNLSTQEWFWEFDTKIAEARRIKEMQTKPGSKFTEGEWAKARKLHSEKMKQNGN
jgi:hypothetical protein